MDKIVKEIVDNPVKKVNGNNDHLRGISIVNHELSEFLNKPSPRESPKWHMQHKPYGK